MLPILAFRRWRRTFQVWLLLPAFAIPGAAQPAPPNILIVYPYRADAMPFGVYADAFKTALAHNLGKPINIYEVSLDSDRFNDPSAQSAMMEFLEKRFAAHRPDLIMPIGAPAARFIVQFTGSALVGVPIVFLSADRRIFGPEPLPANSTLITPIAFLPGYIEDILQMAPDTKNIVTVIGVSPAEQSWIKILDRDVSVFKDRVNFTYLTGMSLDQIEKQVAALPPHSFIFLPLMTQDSAGITYAGYDVLQHLHVTANAPIYGIYRSQVGKGIVGGRLQPDQDLGIRAADAAARILRGEPAASIPAEMLPSASPVYDWRELKRWGIQESRLPAGSLVMFREPTLWQRYRWHITGIVSFFVIETLLILGLLINLRKRRRAEQSLRHGEERFRQVAETVSDFVWEIDRDGLYTFTSPSVEKILGYTPDELVGKMHFYDLFSSDVREQLKAAAFEAFEAKQPFQAFPNANVGKSGTVVHLETSGVPILDQSGRLLGYRGADTDVTGRRKAEMETQLLRQELALFSRAATLGELTASIAHEVNQPLAAILNNAQAGLRLMRSEEPDLTELREILSDIVDGDQRASEIIRSMRSMLKRDNSEHGPISIGDLITDILPIVKNEALMKEVSIVLDLDSQVPSVGGNRIQIQQVILNLVVNAFDAMETSEPPRKLVLRTHQADGEIILDVMDSGSGIPAGKIDSIFEPFFTTKAKGLGIGLSLSRSIVREHKGRIWAENNPDGGATFHVALPI